MMLHEVDMSPCWRCHVMEPVTSDWLRSGLDNVDMFRQMNWSRRCWCQLIDVDEVSDSPLKKAEVLHKSLSIWKMLISEELPSYHLYGVVNRKMLTRQQLICWCVNMSTCYYLHVVINILIKSYQIWQNFQQRHLMHSSASTRSEDVEKFLFVNTVNILMSTSQCFFLLLLVWHWYQTDERWPTGRWVRTHVRWAIGRSVDGMLHGSWHIADAYDWPKKLQ